MAFLTILGTAILTATAAQFAVWAKDKWTAGGEARFSALYAALFFEEYAGTCSHRLGEYEAFISSDGHAGTDHSAMPDLPDFPKEIDWRRIGIRLTESAFAYRVRHQAACNKIADLYEFDGPDGGNHELIMQLIEQGLGALSTAAKIRKAGRLKAAAIPDPEYSVERHLTERRVHHKEIRQRYLASQQTSHEALLRGTVPKPNNPIAP